MIVRTARCWSPVITHVSIGIERAHATLRGATRFFGLDTGRSSPAAAPSKVLGNGLRELDRFLSVLIDEVAATAGLDDAALDRLRSRRNTANKLDMLTAARGHAHARADHRRLRALGRSRDCLFYCDGMVRRADRRGGRTMTAGWPARSSPLGTRLILHRADLDDICRFYDRVADELLAGSNNIASDQPIEPPISHLFNAGPSR